MIQIYIGSAREWRKVEPVLEHSIRKHASAAIEIHWMRPGENGLHRNGCTGFTMFRYCVPELANHNGWAIYLDVDMLLLADIAELFSYRAPGVFATLTDGSSEVMVIDCSVRLGLTRRDFCMRKKWEITHMIPVQPMIPLDWNSEEVLLPETKLLHFTDLDRQPWDHESRDDPAAQKWREYERYHQQLGGV